MDIITQCQFSNPQTFDGQTPTSTEQNFNFQQEICTTTEPRVEYIANESTSTSFYLQETLTYGDFLIIAFLLLFLVFGMASWVIGWFIPKKMDWKQH